MHTRGWGSFLDKLPVADPGFPRGGGANSPGGAPTYDFAKFSQKLHEIERIWAPRGGRASLAPPLRSATDYSKNTQNKTAGIQKKLLTSSRASILFPTMSVGDLGYPRRGEWQPKMDRQTYYVGGSKGVLGPNSFIFMQFSAKIWPNNIFSFFSQGLPLPSPPRRGNLEFAIVLFV